MNVLRTFLAVVFVFGVSTGEAIAQAASSPSFVKTPVLLLQGTTTAKVPTGGAVFSISVDGDPTGELWGYIRSALESHGSCDVVDPSKLATFKPGSVLAVAPVLSRADTLRLTIPGKFRVTYAVTLGFEVLNATTGQVLWSRTCTRDITAKFSEGDEDGAKREERPSFVECLKSCSEYLAKEFKKNCTGAPMEARVTGVGPVPGSLVLDRGRRHGLMKNLALVLENGGVSKRLVVLHVDDDRAVVISKDSDNPLDGKLVGDASTVRLAGAQPMPSGVGGGLQFQVTAAKPPTSYMGARDPGCLDEMTLAAWTHDAIAAQGRLQLLCPLPERGLVLQAQQLLLEVTRQSRGSVLDNMLRPDVCIELSFGAGVVKRTRTSEGVSDFYSLDARMEVRDFASGAVVASFWKRTTNVERSPFVFGKEWREVDSGPTFLDLARVLIQQLAEEAGPQIEGSIKTVPVELAAAAEPGASSQAVCADAAAARLQSGRKFPLLAVLKDGGTFPVGTARVESSDERSVKFQCKTPVTVADRVGFALNLPNVRRAKAAPGADRLPALRWLPAVWDIKGLSDEARRAAELRARNVLCRSTRAIGIDVESSDEFNDRMTRAFFVDDGGLSVATSSERELRTAIPRIEPAVGVRMVVYRLDILDVPAVKPEDASKRNYDLGLRLVFFDVASGKELWRCSQGLEHPNEWREVLGNFVGERAADESSCVLVMIEEILGNLIEGIESDKEYKQQDGRKTRFSDSGLHAP